MIQVVTDNNPGYIRFVLTPNRSISWPILLRFYLLTCVLSFSIAGLFALLGYWIVLPFSGLEMMALGAGLYYTSTKIYRQEVITIDNDHIKLEKGFQKPTESWEFDRAWVQINTEKTGSYIQKIKINMGSHGNYVELGSFLTEVEKESLVFQLNKGIIFRGFMGQTG